MTSSTEMTDVSHNLGHPVETTRAPRPDADRGLPTVCIIGGGSSGMVTCKVFGDHRIPYDCFEASSDIGGMWQFNNPYSSSAYRSLHINTSRRTMEYSDFPMPDDYPDFPHHSLILDYFRSYAEHFGLYDRITFDTKVEHCARHGDGSWSVRLSTGETRRYDAVVVANGHHWNPRWPDPPFPGAFNGESIHAHDYVDETEPLSLRGKKVVIVGMGNSSMDIACELGRKGVAEAVYLSIRTPNHIVPKYLPGGRLLDFWSRHPAEPIGNKERLLRRVVPKRLMNWAAEKMLERAVGKPDQWGLPAPTHRFSESHPTISSEIHYRLGAGDVIPKPNIEELRGDRVKFVDGTTVEADVIIYATGYNISFPFLDRSLIEVQDNDIALYERIFDPRYDNLLFSALVQPLCAMMPIAEQQAVLMAKYLTGQYHLPPATEMLESLREAHEGTKASYVKSARHTVQINCQEYADGLRDELASGFQRARARNFALPVEPRVNPPAAQAPASA